MIYRMIYRLYAGTATQFKKLKTESGLRAAREKRTHADHYRRLKGL